MLSLIRGLSKTEGTNIAKQKQTHREQISGYHDGWRAVRGEKGEGDSEIPTRSYEITYVSQACNVLHREHSQYLLYLCGV